MWVARNDITGKIYPKKFKSIYDCQKYIDTELIKLQFVYSLIVGMESDIDNEEKYNKWYKEHYSDNPYVAFEIYARIEYSISTLLQGCPKNPRNNVIRCYNTEQKRYATGFDF